MTGPLLCIGLVIAAVFVHWFARKAIAGKW